MEEERDVKAVEVRKLRKKLRQIDNLEQIGATRELTESEIAKVERKHEIRDSLKLLIDPDKESTQSQQNIDTNSKLDGDNGLKECMDETVDQVLEEEDSQGESANGEDSETLQTETVGKECEATLAENEGKPQETISDDVTSTPPKTTKRKRTKKNPNDWAAKQFAISVLEGHHHPVCCVDSNEDIIVSGGYDSSVRVWDIKTGEEKHSLGGHVGCVTSVLLLPWSKDEDHQFIASGSLDCSVKVWNAKEGTMVKSLYVFSPVRCIAYGCDVLAVGSDGGKVQLLNLDTNGTIFSVNCHDDAITCIEFIQDCRLVTGSEDGEVKVFDFKDNALEQIFSTEDGIRTVNPPGADTSMESTESENQGLRLRKINCLVGFQDNLIWGDDGYNLKSLDWKTGDVSKLRNNLFEFCPTEALTVLSSSSGDYLFSSGFDLDNGNSYINVRNLPSLDYVGTISTPSLGHINSIKAAVAEDGKIRLITGGSELKVWDEVSRKLKRRADALDDLIPCKYNCSYNTPRESEEEDSEEHSDGDGKESEEEDKTEETNTGRGYMCVIS